jgi:hypothetical protein
MRHIGGYYTRTLGAQPHKGHDGTEKIVGGHVVRSYGGGGAILGIGLAILTGGASLAADVGMAAADTALAVDTIDAVDTIATVADTAAAADTIDTAANAIDTVSSVSDIPADMPADVPTPDVPTPDVPTPDVPAPDGGLPPVNEGPMGPPAPEGSMGPPEPMGPPTPDYNPNGYPDPSQPPYDPNGMPNAKPPDPSKLPSGLSKITSTVAKSFANDLLPKSTPTRALGTSNESALSSATPSGTRMPTCTFLCNQAELLSDKGSGYKGGLEKLQQMPSASAGSASPVCMYAMQDQMNMMGQAPIGSGLGYARGGIAHLAGGAQPNVDVDAQQIWKDAFCANKRGLCFGCDKPELMHYQNVQQCHALRPLKHIYSSMTGGYAKGGLPEKYHAAAPEGHHPEFITGVTGYYACGGGTGQSDDIPAMLHDGDYVMDAETVSALGDGSSKAGKHVLDGFRTQVPHKAQGGSNPVPAKIADGEYVFPAAFVSALGGGDNKRGAEILDGLRTKLRAHKRGAPLDKIPPKAKDPIDYIKKAKA